MKCFYKTEQFECQKSVKYTCADCQIQKYCCEEHGRDHKLHTNHNTVLIWSSGLSQFKKEIKACIKNIANDANAIMAEIRQTSLKAIIQLKTFNKNVKKLEDLRLKQYDANRIHFLIEQKSVPILY